MDKKEEIDPSLQTHFAKKKLKIFKQFLGEKMSLNLDRKQEVKYVVGNKNSLQDKNKRYN